MNVCYFEMDNGVFWFGGGIDFILYYIILEKVCFFYQELQEICNWYDESFYFWFFDWVDMYFYFLYCGEICGIGGIFYDYIFEYLVLLKE